MGGARERASLLGQGRMKQWRLVIGRQKNRGHEISVSISDIKTIEGQQLTTSPMFFHLGAQAAYPVVAHASCA